jgi:hypothetical protein
MKKLRASFILYPFLFGLYPVLALIAHNAGEMDLSAGLRSLLGSLFLTLIIYVLTLLLLSKPEKAALLTSLVLLLFYSYGHINLISRSWELLGGSIGRHRVLVPVYLLLLILVGWLILRTRRDLSTSTRFLNAFAIILLLMPAYQLISGQVQQLRALGQVDHQTPGLSIPAGQTPPDVYYILLDGYPRGDFINQHLDSSNLAFLEGLEQRGFFVAHCSQSNYSDTRFSLASTLNMTYLDGGEGKPEVIHPGSVLDEMIRSGEVQANFSNLGYTIITFESGYKWLRWELSDQHLRPLPVLESGLARYGLNAFERLFLDTTAAKLLLDIPVVLQSEQLAGFIDNPRAAHRQRVLFSLEQLEEIPGSNSNPIFVYAHIIFPHPPFVMDAQGTALDNAPADELSAYADQITYLDQHVLAIVDSILEKSETTPVIILQGDHGATIAYDEHGIDPALRLGILNAYYLPGITSIEDQPTVQLYSFISPVNTFRLVFDTYFNGDYGLLPDLSIIGRQSPFQFLGCDPPE